MKRLLAVLVALLLVLSTRPTFAKDQLQFRTIVVNHFTISSSAGYTQNFVDYFALNLREWLMKDEVAAQIVDAGTAVPASDATESLVIEGIFSNEEKGMLGLRKVDVEINVYRISDHALVKTVREKLAYKGNDNDKQAANFLAKQVGAILRHNLKNMNLASVPAGAPVAATPANQSNAPAKTTEMGEPATLQFTSEPAGAEISVDGIYAGNTPSLIKMKPGTHSIKLTKSGYQPWARTMDVNAGDLRTISAELERVP